MQIQLTVFAGLLGLTFGSFLNVCVSRWPEDESVVSPGSHCPRCGHGLSWWENIPLLSWLLLRGRCRSCQERISLRYPVVEAAVGVSWALVVWRMTAPAFAELAGATTEAHVAWMSAAGRMIFCWLLVGLAALDAEHYWLPNWLTLPGTLLGFLTVSSGWYFFEHRYNRPGIVDELISSLLGIVIPAAVLLLVRWLYWLVRRREGLGLGDVKLMAMLGAWLGLDGAILSLLLGALLCSLLALGLLFAPRRQGQEPWALTKLPLGTFLCIGGLAASFWGPQMVHAYLRYAGFE
jgi:leader peptidase (prepilin peptidase)/N-methyltransferase